MGDDEKYFIRKAESSDQEVLLTISRRVINENFRSFMGHEAVDSFLDSGISGNGCSCLFC